MFVFPQGLPSEKTFEYRTEPVDRESTVVHALNERGVDVVTCDSVPNQRACAHATSVGYDGEQRIENTSITDLPDDQYGLYTDYDYVWFEQGLARPNATLENGTLVLSFEPVSTEAVLRRNAVAFDRLSDVGREAIRNGSVRVARRYHDYDEIRPVVSQHDRLVVYQGDVYQIRRYPKDRDTVIPEWLYCTIRYGGVIVGAVIAFRYAGWHARLTERRRDN